MDFTIDIIPREEIHSSECITMGNTYDIGEEEGWQLKAMC